MPNPASWNCIMAARSWSVAVDAPQGAPASTLLVSAAASSINHAALA
jgi:hypothetical protein